MKEDDTDYPIQKEMQVQESSIRDLNTNFLERVDKLEDGALCKESLEFMKTIYRGDLEAVRIRGLYDLGQRLEAGAGQGEYDLLILRKVFNLLNWRIIPVIRAGIPLHQSILVKHLESCYDEAVRWEFKTRVSYWERCKVGKMISRLEQRKALCKAIKIQ